MTFEMVTTFENFILFIVLSTIVSETFGNMAGSDPGPVTTDSSDVVQIGEDVNISCTYDPVDVMDLGSLTWSFSHHDEGDVEVLVKYICSFRTSGCMTIRSPMKSAKYDLLVDTVGGFRGVLAVSDVTNDDEGNYTCSVVTPMGKFESTARLTVEDFCSRSVMMSPCDPVRAGAPAGLSCSAEVKSPDRIPSLLMAKDGTPVQANRAGSDIRRGTEPLTISYDFVPLVDDHGSQVTCCVQAKSVCPQVCAEPCVIDVQYPPSTPVVASNMSQLTFNEGMTNVRVHCWADGNPKPEDFIRWSKVGHVHEILAQSALRAGESVLEFTALSRRHAGRYRCTAANGVGLSTHTDLEILVQYAPTVVTGKKQTITVNEGQQLTLTCTAEGYPEPDISWLTADSQPITWGVTSLTRVLDDKYKQTVVATLTFDAMVAGRDFGSRWCVASNAMGQDRMVIDIHGKQRPDPPTNVSADASHQSDSIIVTWLPTDDDEADQHFFVKHCLYPEGSPCGEVTGVTRAILILNGLQSDTCYSISVVAENDVGRSDPSDTVLVCTKAAPEVLGFTNLVVIGSGGTVIFVLLITVTLALYCRRRKRARGVIQPANSESLPPLPPVRDVIVSPMDAIPFVFQSSVSTEAEVGCESTYASINDMKHEQGAAAAWSPEDCSLHYTPMSPIGARTTRIPDPLDVYKNGNFAQENGFAEPRVAGSAASPPPYGDQADGFLYVGMKGGMNTRSTTYF